MSRRPIRPGGRYRPSREERVRLRGRGRLRLPSFRVSSSTMIRIGGGIIGVVAVVLIMDRIISETPPGPGRTAQQAPDTAAQRAWKERMEAGITEAALQLGLREAWILVHPAGSPEGDSLLTVVELRVPGDLHLEVLNLAVTRAAQEAGGRITRGVQPHDARVELEVSFQGWRTHRVILQRYSGYRRSSGRIGLIIDDFGRTPPSVLAGLIALGIPWTAAVIPGEPRTAQEVAELSSRGIPLLLHLPMEPDDNGSWDLGPGVISATTAPDQIPTLLEAALSQVPGARGVNNHMGSRATSEPAVMGPLMRALAQKGLFFIDSVTTPSTVGPQEAERAGLAWARRDVFLDPQDDAVIIQQQMREAERLAHQRGQVIVIAHPRLLTLEALQRWIPQARNQGIDFVMVDRLLRRPERK
jgi:polysaccharide deacetylase 2 family uncharacterized protein YibQ